MRKILAIPAACSLGLLLGACEDKPSVNAPAATAPVAVATKAPAPPAAKVPVDGCELLPLAEVAAIIGPISASGVKKGEGPMNANCAYVTDDKSGRLTATVMPSDYLRSSLEQLDQQGKPAKPLSGVGEKAFETIWGVMIQPAGKPYYLVLHVSKEGKDGKALGVELAKKLKF